MTEQRFLDDTLLLFVSALVGVRLNQHERVADHLDQANEPRVLEESPSGSVVDRRIRSDRLHGRGINPRNRIEHNKERIDFDRLEPELVFGLLRRSFPHSPPLSRELLSLASS